jgi:hypothetical protein
VPAAVAGVETLKYLERHLGSDFETVIFTLLAGALLLSGAALLARILIRSTGGEHSSVGLTRARTAQAIVIGALVGFVVGLTSAGSGALIAVALIIWFRLRPPKVVGTDLFHASIVLWAAAIAHVFANDIDYSLAGTTQATILVAAAERPAAQGNWGNADDWLPNTFRAATAEEVLREAAGRRSSTLARLGYLAEWAGRNDIAVEIETLLPSRLPVTSLGPRDRREQWSRRWHVYNSLLSRR